MQHLSVTEMVSIQGGTMDIWNNNCLTFWSNLSNFSIFCKKYDVFKVRIKYEHIYHVIYYSRTYHSSLCIWDMADYWSHALCPVRFSCGIFKGGFKDEAKNIWEVWMDLSKICQHSLGCSTSSYRKHNVTLYLWVYFYTKLIYKLIWFDLIRIKVYLHFNVIK